LFEVVSVQKTATVGDLIEALEDVGRRLGKEGGKIVKLQQQGEDLGVDRLVVTIKSTCFDPVIVLYLEDLKVATVLEVLGVSRSRDEVIAALERSNWDENRAINQLFDPR
jgi:hypothetical protein